MSFSKNVKISLSELSNAVTIDKLTGDFIPIEDWINKDFSVAHNNISPIEINRQENLSAIFNELLKLNKEIYDEDYLAPTKFALHTAEEFLLSLIDSYDKPLPIPNFIPDGEGGIRAEWEIKGRELRLVCPAKNDWKPYLYHEEGDTYKAEKNLQTGTFLRWFNWLVK